MVVAARVTCRGGVLNFLDLLRSCVPDCNHEILESAAISLIALLNWIFLIAPANLHQYCTSKTEVAAIVAAITEVVLNCTRGWFPREYEPEAGGSRIASPSCTPF